MEVSKIRKRDRSVLVRLTENEIIDLDSKVSKTGMSREGYIRSIINGTVPKERPSPELMDVLKELRQISNNMNQVAVKANSTGAIDRERYTENVEVLHDAINKIMGRIFS